METKLVRAVVASESPRALYVLRQAVEQSGNATIVGQARDVPGILALARDVKPDVVIVDCLLPYVFGSGNLPLSRSGGLDIAQAISEEVRDAEVILLTNLNTVASEGGTTGGSGTMYSLVSKGSNLSFGLRGGQRHRGQPKGLLFADIEEQPLPSLSLRNLSFWDKLMLFGVGVVWAGLLMTLTIMLAVVGLPLAVVGAVMMLFGFLGKLGFPRRRGRLAARAR